MLAEFKAFRTPALFALLALAAAANPSPARSGSIKDLVKEWNKRAAEASVDDLLKTYAATTDKAKQLAHEMAEQAVSVGKLQKAVRAKWGVDAEQRVAAACASDTVKDDDEAAVIIKEDHGVLKFRNESISPLLLVKSGGDWKIDSDAYVAALGQHVPEAEKAMRAITATIQATSKQLAAGTFFSADDLVASLKKGIDAIDAGG